MTNFAPYQDFDFTFAKLLADPSQAWAAWDIAYVQVIVSHAEYGDALENLIAIGQQNEKGFSPDHLRQIAELSKAMDIDIPPLPDLVGG